MTRRDDKAELEEARRMRAQAQAELEAHLRNAQRFQAALNPQASLEWRRRIIEAGYRALAREFHPDHGGDAAKMAELNEAAKELRRLL